MDKLYNDLSERYNVSAKEYFKILQLAIFHITGDDVPDELCIKAFIKQLEEECL